MAVMLATAMCVVVLLLEEQKVLTASWQTPG
jgi:hypothetical protein